MFWFRTRPPSTPTLWAALKTRAVGTRWSQSRNHQYWKPNKSPHLWSKTQTPLINWKLNSTLFVDSLSTSGLQFTPWNQFSVLFCFFLSMKTKWVPSLPVGYGKPNLQSATIQSRIAHVFSNWKPNEFVLIWSNMYVQKTKQGSTSLVQNQSCFNHWKPNKPL